MFRFLLSLIVAVDGLCHSSGVVLARRESGPLPVPDVFLSKSVLTRVSDAMVLRGGRFGVALPLRGVGWTLWPR